MPTDSVWVCPGVTTHSVNQIYFPSQPQTAVRAVEYMSVQPVVLIDRHTHIQVCQEYIPSIPMSC